MTLELMAIIMAIIAATISLGGLILAQSRAAARERADLREDMALLGERMTHLEVSLGERMSRLEVSLTERMTHLEVSLTERLARVEGSLDVLREYFAGRGRDAA